MTQQQNDQGWPPYVPPPPNFDESTVAEALGAHNTMMDADGIALLKLIDNRVDKRLNALFKEWKQQQRSKRGDA